MIEARIYVTLKSGILDPQGKTVQQALQNLGFAPIRGVRIGKLIELQFAEEVSREQAERLTIAACKKLLANPVIEDYRFELALNTNQQAAP
jgi:phosphoribosylformylglycinamidine synthase